MCPGFYGMAGSISAMGTEKSKGTMVFALAGRLQGAAYEVPMVLRSGR
jgi:NADH:ubiquinone oxidoreductase subunit F (NADH-binding)